jgi:hypothetical protein
MSSIPNDEQINKISVRTPEELGLFEEMDAERDARYQQEWENAGNAGDYPRLVTYDELPPYLKLRAQDLIREEELPDVRKSRSGNQLSLLDNITESEYTRLNEEGKDPNEHLSEISELRKALRRSSTKRGTSWDGASMSCRHGMSFRSTTRSSSAPSPSARLSKSARTVSMSRLTTSAETSSSWQRTQ